MSTERKHGGIDNEREVYDSAPVDIRSGELLVWDDIVFPLIVRRRQYELVDDIIHAALPQDALDVGCGGGWLTHHLASTVPRVVGVDVSRGLLLNAKAMDGGNTSFVIGDGENLPIADNTFDLIVSVAALHHVNAKRALIEWKRICRVNGHLILIEPNALNLLAGVGRKLFPLETHTLGERPLRPNQVETLLEDAGWQIDQLETQVFVSFAISRVLRLTGRQIRRKGAFLQILVDFERALENVPFLDKFGWVIASVARNVGR